MLIGRDMPVACVSPVSSGDMGTKGRAPLPRHGEASLADVVPSLLSALDVPGFDNPLGIDPARRVCLMCLMLIDGLGLEQLEADSKQALFLTTMATNLRPITTYFPATTVASLGSLGTGRPPGEHGLVGTTVAVPGQTRAMNLLRWSASGHGPATDLRDRIAPERFQPEPTVFERAAADRVSVNLVGPRDHARSGLTRAVLRGGRYESVQSLGELAAMALRHLVGAPRTLVYAYHRDLDLTGHARGVSSDNWRLHLGFVDLLAEQIAERLPLGTHYWRSLATTVWSTSAPSRESTWLTSRSWPPEYGCWPARPAPATSTPRTARRPTSCRRGRRCSVSRCGSSPARRRSRRAGSAHESWTASVPASGTWSRPRVSRSVSSNATSIRARRGWLAITVP